MSKANHLWLENLILSSLKECIIHQHDTIDPYGMCLERFKAEKGYPPSHQNRERLLKEMHMKAESVLPKLKDPMQIDRCVKIIEKTKFDNRAGAQYGNMRMTEIVDMFDMDMG